MIELTILIIFLASLYIIFALSLLGVQKLNKDTIIEFFTLFSFTVVAPVFTFLLNLLSDDILDDKFVLICIVIFLVASVIIIFIYHLKGKKDPLAIKWQILKRKSRSNLIIFLVVMYFVGIITPKVIVGVSIGVFTSNLRKLASLRESISNFYKTHRRYPRSLNELGKVPSVYVWDIESHRHRRTNEVAIIDTHLTGLEVKFTYATNINVRKVALVGNFNNWDTEKDLMQYNGHSWNITKVLKHGIYEYSFLVDGKKKETVKQHISFPIVKRTPEITVCPVYDYIADVKPVSLTDNGKWGYDPETGYIFISCTGKDPKLRARPLYSF
ncbi:MAG: hypothetical protein AB1633_05615 [Elusimicrobiota bacterium]